LALASSGKLSENDFELIIDLFEHNMKHLYQRSNWGFDKTAKRVELENPLARLVFFKLHKKICMPYISIFMQHYIIVALWLHLIFFPFLIFYWLKTLYFRTSMNKIMATVFNFNQQSLSFFFKHNFIVDAYSPDDDSDYLILSRSI
uniref:Sterile domain-containing protein n=1 Tax=Dracunculus medinensis TaxID=318479 RepID=A0A0N4U0G8_DRAME